MMQADGVHTVVVALRDSTALTLLSAAHAMLIRAHLTIYVLRVAYCCCATPVTCGLLILNA